MDFRFCFDQEAAGQRQGAVDRRGRWGPRGARRLPRSRLGCYDGPGAENHFFPGASDDYFEGHSFSCVDHDRRAKHDAGGPTDETESTTYARVEPSLALVAAGHGKNLGFGTAFCIADLGGNNGLLLTNQHVVAGDPYPRVILMSNTHKVLAASVVRTSPLDAAVLLIPSDCRALRLSSTLPAVGARIALAGFPRIQLEAAFAGLGLSPSFHEGTISSLLAEAGLLQYDAQTDHGNSGSPLFDLDSGTVYGLVRAVNTGETGAAKQLRDYHPNAGTVLAKRSCTGFVCEW